MKSFSRLRKKKHFRHYVEMSNATSSWIFLDRLTICTYLATSTSRIGCLSTMASSFRISCRDRVEAVACDWALVKYARRTFIFIDRNTFDGNWTALSSCVGKENAGRGRFSIIIVTISQSPIKMRSWKDPFAALLKVSQKRQLIKLTTLGYK